MITRKDHSKITKRIQDGETLAAVAQTYGCSRQRISQIVLKYGVHGLNKHKGSLKLIRLGKMTPEIVKAFQAGRSAVSIARELATDQGQVRAALKRLLGNKYRAHGRLPQHAIDYIKQEYRPWVRGHGYYVIAKKLGISGRCVQQTAQRLGLNRPRIKV